jgi:hypothetical protein
VESYALGAIVSEVARRHDWRRRIGLRGARTGQLHQETLHTMTGPAGAATVKLASIPV